MERTLRADHERKRRIDLRLVHVERTPILCPKVCIGILRRLQPGNQALLQPTRRLRKEHDMSKPSAVAAALFSIALAPVVLAQAEVQPSAAPTEGSVSAPAVPVEAATPVDPATSVDQAALVEEPE